MHFSTSSELDQSDPLRELRKQYLGPMTDEVRDVYFVGNSLGLQPARVTDALEAVLGQWRELGVHGHFRPTTEASPWMDLPEQVGTLMAPLVGAKAQEVVVMNTLTVNLHLMMASFYRPSGRRTKILIEQHAFPSDHQAVESYLRVMGLDPHECLLTIPATRSGFLFEDEVILDSMQRHKDELALVLLPGVQYYTGQVFDIETITKRARELDLPIGWDLAHAAGNLAVQLSQWGPDFACWCTYKYLNGGPGALGGCFIREDHARDRDLQRLAGWWGHERQTRFQMESRFVPEPTALGWQLSNPPILSMAAMKPSLEIFHEVGGMGPLREKADKLREFFRRRLDEELEGLVGILTPDQKDRSGCQLSLEILDKRRDGQAVFDRLSQFGIHTDWREPNVIRAAPVPLYNSFDDVERFVAALRKSILD